MTRPAIRWRRERWQPAVGDAVHCPHANADGVVSRVGTYSVIVRVTATRSGLYSIGCEDAWMPMDLEPRADPVFN